MFVSLESRRRQQGHDLVAGIDEVGRGALAGPLVATAIILKPYIKLPGLKDSKSLTRLQRERFAKRIRERALGVGIGAVGPQEIDRMGIARANDLAFLRALEKLTPRPQWVLADYFSLGGFSCPVEGVKGGDKRVRTIAAASVVAKVHRDNIMVQSEKRYPGYGFAEHVGYGTAAHSQAIKQHGLTPWHRRSFTRKYL